MRSVRTQTDPVRTPKTDGISPRKGRSERVSAAGVRLLSSSASFCGWCVVVGWCERAWDGFHRGVVGRAAMYKRGWWVRPSAAREAVAWVRPYGVWYGEYIAWRTDVSPPSESEMRAQSPDRRRPHTQTGVSYRASVRRAERVSAVGVRLLLLLEFGCGFRVLPGGRVGGGADVGFRTDE